jgi:hypothetical protein
MAELTKENVKEMFHGTEFEYFVAFINGKDNEVIHMVGYMEQPTVADVSTAIEEMHTDEDFGVPVEVLNTFVMKIFSFK